MTDSVVTTNPERSREVAISLMRLALPLLDQAGDTLAAARLQHAIDTALDTPPMGKGEQLAQPAN